MPPDSIDRIPMRQQQVGVSKTATHPAAQEDPQRLPLSCKLHSPDSQSGTGITAPDPGKHDGHVPGGIDKAKDSRHLHWHQEAIEAGADEKAADNRRDDVYSRSSCHNWEVAALSLG